MNRMKKNRTIAVMGIACACAVWVYNISLMAGIASLSMKREPEPPPGTDGSVAGSSALVDKALGLRPSVAPVRFRGGFESPFKMPSEAHVNTTSAHDRTPPAALSRPRLTLKGVLYKSSPLAILEDAGGATAIIGVGDTLFGQKVTAITKNSVTLRDRHGTYELSVKE